MDYSSATSQAENPVMVVAFLIYFLFIIAIAVVSLIANWKMFVKAGKPGWASLVPIYNLYVILQIVKKPGWWLLLFFVPVVYIIMGIVLALELAKAFGRSTLFGIFLLLLFPIGYLIIGFGKSKYVYATTSTPTPTPTVPKPEETVKPTV